MRPDHLTQRFVEDFTRWIRESYYRGHERLPGQLELEKLYGVSYTTVRRGLKLLMEQKLIYRIKGKGTYAAPRGHLGLRSWVVALVRPRRASLIQEIWFRYLMELRGELLAHSHGLNVFSETEGFLDLRKMCYEDQVRGVVLVDPLFTPPVKALIAFLKKRNVPVSFVEEKEKQKNDNTICLDHRRAGELCAEHLIKTGRKKIAFVAEKGDVIYRWRAGGFLQACKRLGAEGEVLDFPALEWIPESVYRRLQGIALGNESLVYSVLEQCRSYKIVLPGDLGMVVIDGSPVCERSVPTLTSVTQPLTEMARATVKNLLYQKDHPRGREPLRRLSPSVVRREST